MPVPLTDETHAIYNQLNFAILTLPGFDWCEMWSPSPRPAPGVEHYARVLELSEKAAAITRAALASDTSGAGAAALASLAPKPDPAPADDGPAERIELRRLVAEYEPADATRRGLRRRTP